MKNLFEKDNANTHCERCKASCKVAGLRNPGAKMLRRSKEPQGLCINCAVHDWLRNTYPPNMLLAQSGPKILLYPHIQRSFVEIMKIACADARPDEINWDLIVDNWELPFPHKMKPSPTNPCSQTELDEIAAGERPGLGQNYPPKSFEKLAKPIRSLEELNQLEPGLGDEFKAILDERKNTRSPDDGQK
ncbi:hypothetical protein ES703_61644 [subsurface metagenome]